MFKKDFQIIAIIGAMIGVFVQFVIQNLIDSPHVLFGIGIFAGCLAFAPAALFMASLVGKIFPVAYQFAKFAAVGTLNTSIDFGILNLLIFLTGIAGGAGYAVFKAISFLVATTNSFFWNKRWTFEARQATTTRETILFYSWAAGGWALNVSAASFFVIGLGAPSDVSPAIWANLGALVGVGASFLWNFLGYKFVVFKNPSFNS